uniref:NTR domain-containing protein n=1 Tax=Parastrongyloides trichosuri TaxID=131310 RepID=A0A0N4ZJC8_PARTI
MDKNIFLFVIILSTIGGISSCSCPSSIKEKDAWCSLDWIASLTILNKTVNTVNGTAERAQDVNGVKYDVTFLKFYKIPNKVSIPKSIYTGSHSELCGVEIMNLNKEFILAGYIDENKLFTMNLCTAARFSYTKLGNMNVDKVMKQRKKMYEPCKKN